MTRRLDVTIHKRFWMSSRLKCHRFIYCCQLNTLAIVSSKQPLVKDVLSACPLQHVACDNNCQCRNGVVRHTLFTDTCCSTEHAEALTIPMALHIKHPVLNICAVNASTTATILHTSSSPSVYSRLSYENSSFYLPPMSVAHTPRY